MAKRIKSAPPICPACGANAALVGGGTIYRKVTPELEKKKFWACLKCEVWVGCHPGSTRPLGVMADAEVRYARNQLHERRIDPLWKHAERSGGYEPEDYVAIGRIRRTARSRVYAYLAWRLGIDASECHTAMFDLDLCRRAWTALSGATYPEIRVWYKARNPQRPETNDGERTAAV